MERKVILLAAGPLLISVALCALAFLALQLLVVDLLDGEQPLHVGLGGALLLVGVMWTTAAGARWLLQRLWPSAARYTRNRGWTILVGTLVLAPAVAVDTFTDGYWLLALFLIAMIPPSLYYEFLLPLTKESVEKRSSSGSPR